jgi:carboxyl-terminal processing protease
VSLNEAERRAERDVVADAAREKAAEDRPDPLLRETAAILADATALLSGDKQLAAAVLPETGRASHWAE